MSDYDNLHLCSVCGDRETTSDICWSCRQQDMIDRDRFDGTFDEPKFYECAMCGMEIVTYEIVRKHKYCHSCAAIERHG